MIINFMLMNPTHTVMISNLGKCPPVLIIMFLFHLCHSIGIAKGEPGRGQAPEIEKSRYSNRRVKYSNKAVKGQVVPWQYIESSYTTESQKNDLY